MSAIATLRTSLNQLTDHGSQRCLDCLHHRQRGVEAVDAIEKILIDASLLACRNGHAVARTKARCSCLSCVASRALGESL